MSDFGDGSLLINMDIQAVESISYYHRFPVRRCLVIPVRLVVCCAEGILSENSAFLGKVFFGKSLPELNG
jgi:hypothetical protein